MDPLSKQILNLLVLFLLGAFFSFLEAMLLSVINEKKVNKDLQEDSYLTKLQTIIQDPLPYFITLQFFHALCFILANVYCTWYFAPQLSLIISKTFSISQSLATSISIILLVILTVSLFTMLSQLLPKKISLSYQLSFPSGLLSFVLVLYKIIKPLVSLQHTLVGALLSLCQIDPHALPEEITQDEILNMMEVGSENGSILQNERNMIQNIFDFGDLVAQDVMVHRKEMVAISITATKEEIVSIITKSGRSRLPVYESDIDHIIGVLSSRDFFLNEQRVQPRPLSDLIRKPQLVPESVSSFRLFQDMQKNKSHMAIVLDEYGGTSGLVTMEDLLEEIVGNIYDEFDANEEFEIEKIDDIHWRVSGTIDLETLCKNLEIEQPEVDLDTLGALVFSLFPSIPDDGETPTVEIYGMKIEVEKIVKHRIQTALVSLIEKNS